MKIFDIIDSFDKEPEISTFKNNSVAIMDDDGNRLFDITLNNDGSLEVISNGTLMLNGKILDSALIVKPRFQNSVIIERPEYKR